jgi:hypothetical protein
VCDYGVLFGEDTVQDLVNKVHYAISNGWEPQGGIAIRRGPVYFQAVIKRQW